MKIPQSPQTTFPFPRSSCPDASGCCHLITVSILSATAKVTAKGTRINRKTDTQFSLGCLSTMARNQVQTIHSVYVPWHSTETSQLVTWNTCKSFKIFLRQWEKVSCKASPWITVSIGSSSKSTSLSQGSVEPSNFRCEALRSCCSSARLARLRDSFQWDFVVVLHLFE